MYVYTGDKKLAIFFFINRPLNYELRIPQPPFHYLTKASYFSIYLRLPTPPPPPPPPLFAEM